MTTRWRRFRRWMQGRSRKAAAAEFWQARGMGLRLAIATGLSERGAKMVARFKRHGERWKTMRANTLLGRHPKSR